ncbi:MAG: tetratricopeptide repeat protein, partial [Verrucomicrobia bacterium]|nr:tetratricopeptide repeat protein [Verrucomicrobiota bacterium]
FDEATAMMRDILRLTREAWGPHSPLTLSSKQNLADLYLRTDRPQQALEQMEPVVVWRERLLGEDHSDVLNARYIAASAALKTGQPEKALEHLQPAIDIRREQLEPDDPNLRETLRLAADIHQKMGDSQGELAHRQEAIDPLIDGQETPGQDALESAIRLLKLYGDQGASEHAQTLAKTIEGWLEDGDEEFDELRARYRRVTVTESAAE